MNTSFIFAQKIADILCVSVQAIHKRAKKEAWKFEIITCRGGHQKAFLTDSLPDPVKFAIFSHNSQFLAEASTPNLTTTRKGTLPAKNTVKNNSIHMVAPAPKPILEGVETPIRITLDQQPKALAKASLIKMYAAEVARAPYGKKEQAKVDFITAYNMGLAYPALYKKLGPLSIKTIEGWKLKLKATKDCFVLADSRGKWRKGATVLSPENTGILLKCALHPNKPLKAEAIRLAIAIMHREGVSNGASEMTYRRWLENWIANNYDTWIRTREGKKAWNDKCCFSIPRDFSRIEVGDVLVADGHVLNFEIINPFTGKPKRMTLILWFDMKSSFPLGWEILPTENTQGIASALRRAIIQLGKLPAIAYLDNGRAFSSRFFNGADLTPVTGLFERTGMESIFAWPYHGQSKTIERFFKTFAELERYIPTYSGTSIENKPPRMMRNEIIHRRVYDQVMNGQAALTLWQAHFLVAIWFDEYVTRSQRGHLKGACPLDVFEAGKGPGVDPVALRYLMMAEHISQPSKEGIRFMGQNYYHPDLASLRKKVLIRYDLQDRDSILVFEADDSSYICTASVLEACHPVATLRGTEADRQHLSNMIEMKKSAEKKVSRLSLDMLRTTVMPETTQMLAMIPDPQAAKPAPEPKRLLSPEAIEAEVAQRLAENQEYNDQAELARRQAAAQKAEMDRILRADFEETFKTVEPLGAAAELRYELERLNEADRYEKLQEMEIMGQMLTKSWQAFMRYFETTSEYQRHQSHYETRRTCLKAAMTGATP